MTPPKEASDPSADILDIYLPEPPPDYWAIVLWSLFALLGLAALTAGLIYYRHLDRQQRERAGLRTPHAVALGQLDRLEGEAGELYPNEFALRLSTIIKDFLHARHGDRFRFETAEEFLARAHDGRALSLPPATRESMLDFVDRCDEIKFGRPADAAEKCSPLYSAARRIIETSPPTETHLVQAGSAKPDSHVTAPSAAR